MNCVFDRQDFKEVIEVNDVTRVVPHDWCPHKERRSGHRHSKKGHVRIQGEGRLSTSAWLTPRDWTSWRFTILFYMILYDRYSRSIQHSFCYLISWVQTRATVFGKHTKARDDPHPA